MNKTMRGAIMRMEAARQPTNKYQGFGLPIKIAEKCTVKIMIWARDGLGEENILLLFLWILIS